MKNENKDKLIGVLLVITIILVLTLFVVLIVRDDDHYEERRENNTISDTNSNTNNNTNNDNTNSSIITGDEALQKVLDDIKVSKDDLYDLDIDRDYKYGTDVYEIDFKYDGFEYEYYINVNDGSIVHSFKERD